MSDKVYRFSVEVDGEVLSFNSYRILDDTGNLVGGFVLESGQKINCYVSGARYPACLAITTGDQFFLTPFENNSGKIEGAYLTDYKLKPTSILVPKAL